MSERDTANIHIYFQITIKTWEKLSFFQKLALQRQKEACHQAGSAARKRATPQVPCPQFQRQAHRHLHEGHSQTHPHEASQASLRCRLLP